MSKMSNCQEPDDWSLPPPRDPRLEALKRGGTALGGLSRFERERAEREEYLQEAACHAFSDDYRDWGWFGPDEWYAAVRKIRDFNEAENSQ